MGEVISIHEAHHARRRRREGQLNARCRVLIVDSLEGWRDGVGAIEDGRLRRRRVRMLGELLSYTDRLP